MPQKHPNSLAYRWSHELVGTPTRLMVNILGFSIAGLLSLLSATNGWLILLFCGAFFPTIFSYCLFHLLRDFSHNQGQDLGLLFSPSKMKYLFLLDTAMLITFIMLIINGFLTSVIFKIIACPVIPSIQLVCLRILHIFNHN